MPVYSIQGPDGRTYSIEGPAGATREQVIQAIQERMGSVPAPAPTAPPTERTWGEAAKDIGASALGGAGALLQFPGQLVKLVPGLQGVGEALETPGEFLSKTGEDLKSAGLKAREAIRSKAISEAEKDGILSEFATAITSTIKDPALLGSFVSEQLPLLIGPLGAAKVAQKLGAKSIEAAGKDLAGEAAQKAMEEAAKRVAQTATTAAVGTGAAMQTADVSSDTFENALRIAKSQGLSDEEANQVALNAARLSAPGALAASLLATKGLSKLGGSAIEQRLAGLPGTGRLRSGAGEAVSEALEEAGGALSSNIGVQQFADPTQSLTAGVGAAAGLGALGGGLFGSVLGAKPKPELAPGQREGESLYEAAQRLNIEIKLLDELARPTEQDPARQSFGIKTGAELADMYRTEGAGAVQKYQLELLQRAKSGEVSAEEREEAKNAAQSVQGLLNQASKEEVARRQTMVTTNVITDKDVVDLGITRQDPLYKQLVGKDVYKDAEAVIGSLEAALNRKGLRQTQREVISAALTNINDFLSTVPGSGFLTEPTVGGATGEGAGVAGVPAERPAAARPEGTEPTGMVRPDEAAGELAGGEAGQPAPVRPKINVEGFLQRREGEDDAAFYKRISSKQATITNLAREGDITEEQKQAYDAALDEARKAATASIRLEDLSPNSQEAMKIADEIEAIGGSGSGGFARGVRLAASKNAVNEQQIAFYRQKLEAARNIKEQAAGAKEFEDRGLLWINKDDPRSLDTLSFVMKNGEQADIDLLNDANEAMNRLAKSAAEKGFDISDPSAPPEVKRLRDSMSAVGGIAHRLTTKSHQILKKYKTAKPAALEQARKELREEINKVDQVAKKSLKPETEALAGEVLKREEAAPVETGEVAAAADAKARRDELVKQLDGILKRILAKYGLKGVTLNLDEAFRDEGSYQRQVITMALNLDNPVRVLRHESIHALKDMGFFSDAQWKVLEKRAKDEWIGVLQKTKHDDTQSRYDAYVALFTQEGSAKGLTGDALTKYVEEAVIEEAIADAFGDFDAKKAPPGLMNAILNRMRNLFKAIKEAFGKAGIESAEDIFGKIEEGKLKPTKEIAPKVEAEEEEQGDKSSIRVATKNEKVSQWIKKVNDQFPVSPLDSNQRAIVFDEENFALFELSQSFTRNDAAEIKWIQAYPLRGGNGSKAIRILQNLAEKDGIALTLFPWDKGRVSKASLIRFYKRMGFKPVAKGGDSMVWEPPEEMAIKLKSGPEAFSKSEKTEEAQAKPSLRPQESNAWQASDSERQEAMNMYNEDGFLPYVSQGFLNVPLDGKKYSLQKYNPEKHLAFDPVLNVPINKDGTITAYYHTTKAGALNINNNKMIAAEGRNRIYLTNESGGADVLRNRGSFDQELDGSTVLVYVTPDMLQVDQMYDNGRVDFFIPLAQGEYFNKKMKMQSIQKARTEAIAQEFSYDDHEEKITKAVEKYKASPASVQKAMVKRAKEILKREHNVASLLTENGKLEKTRIGEYDLSYDGLPVASQGLGLASAQKITDKTSTCPRSSICEGLCLGETSGGNFMFGGAAAEDVGDIQKSAFRAGARMMQYLKTEALIVHPQEFAVLLQSEIDALKRWSEKPTQRKKNPETGKVETIAKEIYAPAVRLNVTSDFKPEMFRGVIEGNPDVMFYDYTKINSNSIADNHHLTYSSTGFGQIVDGERVFFKNKAGNYDHNWGTVRQRLNDGFNVAMAFSSKSGLPKTLTDEETGIVYKVLDGDLYDARFLDEYSPEKRESEGRGVIVGLRNKAGTLSEKNATQKTGGFFVNYDPKRDGNNVTVPDQAQFKPRRIPIAAKPSLRAPQTEAFKRWFGDSKVVDENGEPLVMYHGTEEAFTTFMRSGSTKGKFFFSPSEQFASGYGDTMAVYLSIQNPFRFGLDSFDFADYWSGLSDADRDSILSAAADTLGVETATEQDVEELMNSSEWGLNEEDTLHNYLQAQGYDGAIVNEDGVDNFIAYNSTQIKSATGNSGTYDLNDPDIRRSLRSQEKTPQFKFWFGKSTIVDKDGNPKVMYHGTGKDYEVLGTGRRQANAIFLTDDPEFAEKFAKDTFTRAASEAATGVGISEEAFKQGIKRAVEAIRKDYKASAYGKDLIAEVRKGYDSASPEAQEYMTKAFRDAVPAGPNIIPVYVKAEYPFDYENPEHVAILAKMLTPDSIPSEENRKKLEQTLAQSIAKGDWEKIERPEAQAIIRQLGFDGFYVQEGGRKSLAVYNPNQVKSVFNQAPTAAPELKLSLRGAMTPQMVRSMDKIAPPTYRPNLFERILDGIHGDTFTSIRKNIVNRYERLAEYDRRVAAQIKQSGGVQQLADSKAESAALFSDLGAGLLETAMGAHDRWGGAPVFRNGVATVSNLGGTVKGPILIFKPLSDLGDPDVFRLYQTWSAVKRGSRLNVEGREQLVDAADIAAMRAFEQANPNISALFNKVQKDWIAYNNALVKFMVDTGVITPAMAKEYTKHGDYFPFYRLIDDQDVAGPKMFTSIGNVKQPKKLKGGEQPLGDFFENIVRNSQSAIQAGIKNIAAQRATAQALRLQEVTRLTRKESGVNVYRVLENGQEVYYRSHDPLFIDAIKAMNMPDLPFIGLLAGPANLLRNLVTKDPAFMLANMMRDSLSAYVTSGVKMKPLYDTFKNFTLSLANRSPELQKLYAAGVLGGYDYAQGIKTSGPEFEKRLREVSGKKTTGEKLATPFTSLWGALEKGTQASDAATRIEVYKRTLAETGNEAEAYWQALEVMNFNRKGASPVVRVLTAAIPFLNARMQGLDLLFRTAIFPIGGTASDQAKQRMKTFWVRGMTLMAMSSMYWLLTHDDEEYKKQEQETRDGFWLIPSLGIKIPIPFEVGVIFKVIPERIMGVTFGQDTNKDFTDAMKRQFFGTFGFNMIPQVALPIVETMTNYSFFTGRPIIGQGMENIEGRYQVGPGTSRVAELIGQASGFSPMKTDALIKGYTGTIGQYAADLFDAIYDMTSDAPKASKRFEQMPVIRRFALDPEARGQVTAYYDLKNRVDEAVRTSNLLERTMQLEEWIKYSQDKAGVLASRGFISDMDKSMTDFREMRQMVMSSPMSADMKRDTLKAIGAMESALNNNIQMMKRMAQ